MMFPWHSVLLQIYEMGEKTGRSLQLSPPLRVDFSHAGNQEGLEYEVGGISSGMSVLAACLKNAATWKLVGN